MTSDKPPVLSIVGQSKKPAGKKTGKTAGKEPNGKESGNDSGGGSGGDLDKEQRFGEFAVLNGAFIQFRTYKGEETKIKLCNFTCRIIEEVIADDGQGDTNFLRIEGRRNDGMALPSIEVPTKIFSGGQNWFNDYWGMRPVIYTGNQKKDSLRLCIQLYSMIDQDIPRRTIYKYTGWKKLNDHWHYLTGSGAITAEGLVNDLQVDLGHGSMTTYRLPPPLAGDALKSGVESALRLLDVCPHKPHIGAVMLAMAVRAPLGECKPVDFVIWLHGLTGSHKSSIAALALAFFGGEFGDGRAFPATWTDSTGVIEVKSFRIKDGLFVIDDFKPLGGKKDDDLYKKADDIVRNTGNSGGRDTLTQTRDVRSPAWNRSATIITGEDSPRGSSILARALTLEISHGDTHIETLTHLQDAAMSGVLAGVMSAFIQWLAPRMDSLKQDFPALVTLFRDAAIRDKLAISHTRAPTAHASLRAATQIFTDFLEDVSAIDADDANDLMHRFECGLNTAFFEQSSYQAEQDVCLRFIELLQSELSAGNCHLADVYKQNSPATRPHSCGWRKVEGIGDDYRACGQSIGWWVPPKNDQAAKVYLNISSALSVAEKCAASHHQPLQIGSQTELGRQLMHKSLIERERSGRPDPRKSIGGIYHRVWVMPAEQLLPSTDTETVDD